MEEWTIGEVARRTGLRPSAIRYYEAAGLLPRPPRRGGRRMFEPLVLQRVALIELMRRGGFTIAEMRTLLHGFTRRTAPSARWRTFTKRKLDELAERIARARAMQRVLQRIRQCACPTLDDCGRLMMQARARGPQRPSRPEA
jgi:MerR family transcriptional regulator, redox-sensitive transcriptional activator SoxR